MGHARYKACADCVQNAFIQFKHDPVVPPVTVPTGGSGNGAPVTVPGHTGGGAGGSAAVPATGAGANNDQHHQGPPAACQAVCDAAHENHGCTKATADRTECKDCVIMSKSPENILLEPICLLLLR